MRGEIKDKLKKAIKDGLSEDLEKDAENDLQKVHDKYIKKIDELLDAKQDVYKRQIQGIYQTNLTQYDRTTCFIDLYTAVKLNGWEPDQASGAEVTVADFSRIDDTESLFIDRINRSMDSYGATYSSKTIQEINPQIFQWLNLLDLNVWIILALMLAVAGVTMVSGDVYKRQQ